MSFELSIYDYVDNTWDILCILSDTEKVEIPQSSIDCYEDLFDKGSKRYNRFPTSQEFVDGYLKTWRWATSSPRLVEVEGQEYLLHVPYRNRAEREWHDSPARDSV